MGMLGISIVNFKIDMGYMLVMLVDAGHLLKIYNQGFNGEYFDMTNNERL
jgi:hypothetical protein